MVWNVDPEIVSIGPFSLRYYSLMFIIGFLLMGEYVKKLFQKYGKDPELVGSLTTYIIVGMLTGSRLVHCFFYEPQYYFEHLYEVPMIWKGGLASHGGYLGVIIAVWLFMKKHPHLKFFWIMDLIAGPCLFVGGLIRIGNLFNSEIVGKTTDVPWAVIFQRVDPFPRHPAQVYEAIGYFTIAGILCLLERKKFTEWKRGSILAVAIILSFTFRFFIEFVKDEQATISLTPSLNMGQLLSIAFVIGGIVLWMRVRKNPE
ncbi:MAG: prolipoprotein diacylglyceryl transferase [Bacteriovoracaceae bacterium]